MLLIIIIISYTLIKSTNQHGIFWEPPSRASLGKHNNNICSVPIDYNHNSLYCGGVSYQHSFSKGKCAICGDPYQSNDRPHEVPGQYATGIIGRSYFTPGQVIDVYIDIVANHGGFFGFKLCNNNNPKKDPLPTCFEKYPLKFENGESLYHIALGVQGIKRHKLKLRLPPGLTCWQCILQWTWISGNNWGKGPQSFDYFTQECIDLADTGKVGCGGQETFRGCADICIGPKCPRELCEKAKPFTEDSSDVYSTTVSSQQITMSTTFQPILPPVNMNNTYICKSSYIKYEFYSILGNNYCRETCINNAIDYCNLYICDCVVG